MSQDRIPAAFIRGGTSKAVVLKRADLPEDEAAWAPLFAALMGSPDPYKRQLDGMGGGLSSLSKVCIVGPPTRSDADVDYTFAQVGVTTDQVDFTGNCGNMSSAIGPFAYDEGLVAGPREGMAEVRINNTNSGKIILARFPVRDGRAVVGGTLAIPGVPGTGAPVSLDFLDPADTFGKGVLREGRSLHRLTLADGRRVRATMIDAAVPSVFVDAGDVGGDAGADPADIDADAALMARLEEIRCAASVRMGLTGDLDAAARRMATPKVAMVGKAGAYRDLSGTLHPAESHDLQIRMISAGQAHRAVPVTGALALACAAAVDGSVVAACLPEGADVLNLRIATPSGILSVGAMRDPDGTGIRSARILRTQRRLMDGYVYLRAPMPDFSADQN
ncbi:PrpF domain-containing protein [Stappia sp.]|uniref:PrpF domain-containing protein n=1 Tax=Stappia sp. TaxID=1870903 RepID=UPI003C7A9CC9